jgi:predicted acylesterase/phospholipase RssA
MLLRDKLNDGKRWLRSRFIALHAGRRNCVPDAARLIYAIFEGGGAKGIAHLGAVAAIEELQLSLAGVAGASAGAFVAALLAAGYRSTELLNPDTATSNLLATQGLEPIDLLGADKWLSFNRMLRSANMLAKAAVLAGMPGAFCARPRSLVTLAMLSGGLGHFSTNDVRDFVNARVRERLRDLWASRGDNPNQVPDPVCFKDLDYEKFTQLRPLKIIATDVLQTRPILFDRIHTPDVPIGDAVAASIAIPVVFRPVTVRGLPSALGKALFVDGGLVSNLPFWVFSEEKMAVERANPADPPVPIIAFTLKEDPTAPPPPAPGTTWRDRLGLLVKASLKGALLGGIVALIGWAAAYLTFGTTIPSSWWMAGCVALFTLASPAVVALVSMWRAQQARLQAAADKPPSFVPFLTQAVRTGIFGSQLVAQSLLRDVVQVPLFTRLTLLGFDRPWLDIRTDYISGRPKRDAQALRDAAKATRLPRRKAARDGRTCTGAIGGNARPASTGAPRLRHRAVRRTIAPRSPRP